MRAPRDTSLDIWSRQVAAYRAMGPDERLRRAVELSESVKALALDGIRHEHADWPETRVQAELVRRLFANVGRRHIAE